MISKLILSQRQLNIYRENFLFPVRMSNKETKISVDHSQVQKPLAVSLPVLAKHSLNFLRSLSLMDRTCLYGTFCLLFSLLSLVLLRPRPAFRAGSQYAEGSQEPSHLRWPLSPKHHLPHPGCESLLPGQITSPAEPCSVLSLDSTAAAVESH